MSKERARRREAREREAAVRTAARAREAEKRERRTARTRQLRRLVPQRHSRQTGVLAERRRRQAGLTVAVVIAVNLLGWLLFRSIAGSAFVLLVTLLGAPVLYSVTTRR